MKPAKIFDETPTLPCDNCGKDLLKETNGIFAIYKADSLEYLEKVVYFSCKGKCDQIKKLENERLGLSNGGWNDIDDIMIPTGYLKSIMAFINDIRDSKMSVEAIEKMKQLYIRTFPFISRELTENEKERMQLLNSVGL